MKHFFYAELLRVIRRLGMKEQWTDTSVQCLTLRTLRLVLSDNPRGQNHFKSIGGLEVLLDGLGFPYTNVLLLKNEAHIDAKRFTHAHVHMHTHEERERERMNSCFRTCILQFTSLIFSRLIPNIEGLLMNITRLVTRIFLAI